MLCLVASDNEASGREVQSVLLRSGLECARQCPVPLESAADRASRLAASLVVVVMPADAAKGLALLRELNGTIAAHVLAVGSGDDPQVIEQALELGAVEFLDETRLVDELTEAIVRFKTRRDPLLPAKEESCRIISVLASSGGSGSSIIAANIATVLAQKHVAAGLVDLRLAAGDLASLLDLQPTYTLGDLCENLNRVDHAMLEKLFAKHSSGVHLLAAPREFSQIEKVTSRGVRQALALARGQFPYLVLDVENAVREEQVEALWQSDIILLVIRLDYISLRNARRTLEHLQHHGMSLDRVRVVVNRYGEAKQLGITLAEEALGMKISHYIPDDPGRIHRAINAGVPVVLQKASARVSRSLANLAHSVNGRH